MFENLPRQVKVVEVGPRDGLQNEVANVSTADKIRLIEALGETGLEYIEVTSFVSPKWIPQLADGLQVCQSLNLSPKIHRSALVPNLKGYAAAQEAGLGAIAVFMSATETHSKKNINKDLAEALKTIAEIVTVAKQEKKFVRAYLSVVFLCPYEGRVDPTKVVDICLALLAMGVDEISLGDTIGAATPNLVLELLKRLKLESDLDRFALHFHDTFGMALANVVAGLEMGIKTFDASIGGMGGCPYAPGAQGNLATEDLVYLLHSLGVKTGIDLRKLVACGHLAEQILKRQLPGKYLRASGLQSGKIIYSEPEVWRE